MNQLRTWLDKGLTMNRVFQFSGTLDDLNSRIAIMKDDKWSKELLYSKYIDVNHYRIWETTLATYIGYQGDGGVLDIKIKKHKDDLQLVYLSTRLRGYSFLALLMLIVVIGLWLSFLIAGDDGAYPIFMFMILLTPFLWFVSNSHYRRRDDRRLLEKVVRRLRLREVIKQSV